MSKGKYTGYKKNSIDNVNMGKTTNDTDNVALVNEENNQAEVAETDIDNITNNVEQEKPKSKGIVMDDEAKSLMGKLISQNEMLEKSLVSNKRKIDEQDTKINDMVSTFTNLLQNPEQLAQLISGAMQPTTQNTPQVANQEGQNAGVAGGGQDNTNPQSASPAAQQRVEAPKLQAGAVGNLLKSVVSGGASPSAAPGTFNLESIKQLVNAIAVITSNVGGRSKQAENPMSMIENIQSSVALAGNIAGSLSNGLGKIFEGFNSMEDRAWKSWQKRNIGQSIDKNVLKDAVRDVILESKNKE